MELARLMALLFKVGLVQFYSNIICLIIVSEHYALEIQPTMTFDKKIILITGDSSTNISKTLDNICSSTLAH